MQIPPFLLDQWLEQKFTADPPVEFDLGSSTGPVWTVRELLALEPDAEQKMLSTALSYTHSTGTPELLAEIGAMYGVDSRCVHVSTGGAEALLILFHLAAEPGANVVLPDPGYPANSALAQALGLEQRSYGLRSENGFQVDPDEIRSLIDPHTKFVLLNSPHNPTGAVIGNAELDAIHDLCISRRTELIVDEVYHPIYHGADLPSAARLEHAIVLGDFSKALCLSGLRTGWIVDRDPVRRSRFNNARSIFTASNTPVGELLGAVALRHRDAVLGRARLVAAANLALLDTFFAAHAGTLQCVRPAGGFTAMPWLLDGSDGRGFCRRAMQHGIMLAPGDCFGMPAHFRIGFGAAGPQFATALARLDAMLSARGAVF
jgi:aspartate/methionine/tyrosine aminotransferase